MIWFSSIRFARSGLSFYEWEMFYFDGVVRCCNSRAQCLSLCLPQRSWLFGWSSTFIWFQVAGALILYIYSLRSCRCGSNLFRIFAVNAPATATSCWEALRTLNKSEKSKHTTRENIACNNAAELRPHIPYHTEPYHTIYYTILYHIVRSTAASACEHTNMQIIVHTATTPTTNNPTTGGQPQQQGGTGRFVCPARQWRKTEATTWSPLN